MWYAFIIGLTVLNAVASLPTNDLNEDIKIVGGQEIDIKQAPYIVFVRSIGQIIDTYCGGSIIAKDFILTAGSCIYQGYPHVIRAGSANRSSGGVLVEGIGTKHPGNQENILLSDVGLIKLEKPLELSDSIQIIKMADKDYTIPVGDLLQISGWGRLKPHAKGYEIFMLRMTEIRSVSWEYCKNVFIWLINKSMICAGGDGKSACSGDKGGPLVHNGTVVGIYVTGWYDNCAGIGYPGIYTNVASFRQWIDEKMN